MPHQKCNLVFSLTTKFDLISELCIRPVSKSQGILSDKCFDIYLKVVYLGQLICKLSTECVLRAGYNIEWLSNKQPKRANF